MVAHGNHLPPSSNCQFSSKPKSLVWRKINCIFQKYFLIVFLYCIHTMNMNHSGRLIPAAKQLLCEQLKIRLPPSGCLKAQNQSVVFDFEWKISCQDNHCIYNYWCVSVGALQISKSERCKNFTTRVLPPLISIDFSILLILPA